MANYEATRYDFDGASLTGIEGVNTGLIIPWGNNSTPSGFLDCDGSAVSRSTYANLFAVIGTNYGVGDGSTTFNLPDLTDRTCVGKSPTKSQFTTGGANAVTSTGNVPGSAGNTTLGSPEIASHSHPGTLTAVSSTFNAASPGPRSCYVPGSSSSGSAGGDGAHAHGLSANFVGGSDSVLQPFLTLKYVIKA